MNVIVKNKTFKVKTFVVLNIYIDGKTDRRREMKIGEVFVLKVLKLDGITTNLDDKAWKITYRMTISNNSSVQQLISLDQSH